MNLKSLALAGAVLLAALAPAHASTLGTTVTCLPVPILSQGNGAMEAVDVSAFQCGFGGGLALLCNGDTGSCGIIDSSGAFSCNDAGKWTVKVDVKTDVGITGAAVCGGNDVSACAGASAGGSDAKTCATVGNSGDGDGKCEARFGAKPTYADGHVTCEDPLVPGKLVRLLVRSR